MLDRKMIAQLRKIVMEENSGKMLGEFVFWRIAQRAGGGTKSCGPPSVPASLHPSLLSFLPPSLFPFLIESLLYTRNEKLVMNRTHVVIE